MRRKFFFFFFFNDTATTEIYTLSLHDALPISVANELRDPGNEGCKHRPTQRHGLHNHDGQAMALRSEEHTSELQSPCNLVCRLLLEKKKKPSIPANIAV